ncbi:hypothetical protein V493_05160 [Pseudogymnoascus sp. VKM F-4281 (FW-2241)]|nr:hypothetical protein V493_05160 [Pseudogymnoascus sp. VKM F-4281 (FW-2241)]
MGIVWLEGQALSQSHGTTGRGGGADPVSPYARSGFLNITKLRQTVALKIVSETSLLSMAKSEIAKSRGEKLQRPEI